MALGLNHFYVTVDSATYGALEASDFLRAEFGVYEKRTTVRRDLKYSGIYFYGKTTYFEFFDAAGGKLGSPSGLAMGVDEAGELAQYGGGDAQPITRQLNGKDIPWFLMRTYTSREQGALAFWGMEYMPEFLQQWNAQAATPVGVKRGDILARYQAMLRARWDQRLLEDVERVTVALNEAELAEFQKAAPKGIGGFVTAVAAKGSKQGVVRADFRLTRNLPTKYDLPFGSTRLILGPGRSGYWLY